jgi:pimeloyl-ACP methyl ester carboxylesterase
MDNVNSRLDTSRSNIAQLRQDTANQDLNASKPYNFVLVDGAFGASCWKPFGKLLYAAGHNVIYPELPNDPNATFEDDTEAVQKATYGLSNLVPLYHSRGAETARQLAIDDTDRFIGAILISSGGPHAYYLDPKFPEAHYSRYTAEYEAILISKPDRTQDIDRSEVQSYLFNDVLDPLLLSVALSELHEQRDSAYDTSPIFELPTTELAIEVWLGEKDRALNIPRAMRVWQEWAGVTPILLPCGHTPQLSMIDTMAHMSIQFANNARNAR